MTSPQYNDFALLPSDIIFDVASGFISLTDLNQLIRCRGPWRKTIIDMLKSLNRACYCDAEGFCELKVNRKALVHFKRKFTSAELTKTESIDSLKITDATFNYWIQKKLPDMWELHKKIAASKYLQVLKIIEIMALDSNKQRELYKLIEKNSRITDLTLHTIDKRDFCAETEQFLRNLIKTRRLKHIMMEGNLSKLLNYEMVQLIQQRQFQQCRVDSQLDSVEVCMTFFESVLEAFLSKKDFQLWIQKFMFEVPEYVLEELKNHVVQAHNEQFNNETARIQLCKFAHPNNANKLIEIRLYQLVADVPEFSVEILLTSGSDSIVDEFGEYEGLRGTIVEAMDEEEFPHEDDLFPIAH